MTPSNDSLKMRYLPTRTQYLVKNSETGMYYAAKKVGKFLRRRSLKTTSETIAKAKLAEELLSMHTEYGQISTDAHTLTFAQCAAVYMQQEENRTDLKDSSLKYRRETMKMLEKTWPGYGEIAMRKLHKEDVMRWAKRVDEMYGPTRFNGLLDTMRGVLEIAAKQHVIKANWAKEVPRKNVPIVAPELPTNKQFQRLLAGMDTAPQARQGAIFVRLLAYTGLRIGHALLLTPEHVDLRNGWLNAPAFKFSTGSTRIPILEEARPLLEELLRACDGPRSPLLPIKSPRVALRNASKLIGIHVTPHKLRHYFTTRCLECGVDVKTVAGWLGHKDGGALLLKRYAHLRDEHSKKMAEKVKFT